MIRFTLFVLVLFCFPTLVLAQKVLHWGDLKPGTFSVGYRSMLQYDHSRTFIAERNYEGKLFTGSRSRPLQIQIFYPAQVSANAQRMSFSDYLNFKADSPAAATVVKGLGQRTQEIHDYFQRKYLQTYKNGLYDKLMRIQAVAVRNAPAAKGRFPVIIYGGGANFGTNENVVLWEYLASHGYLIAIVPTMGANSVGFSADAAGLETLTRDMEFLLAQVRELPTADMSRVGAMGFSYGGQAALLLAMRNPDIKAVVGLDPSFIGTFHSQFLKNSPFYNADKVAIPILEMHRKDEQTVTYDLINALKYSERYSFEINDLNHVDFTNFVLLYNAVLPDTIKQNSPIISRKTSFEAMSRYILDFLNIYLKADKTKKDRLKNTTELSSNTSHSANFRYLEALPAPPSYSDLLQIIREQGIIRAEQVYREVLRRDPKANVISERSINDLGYELMSIKKIDEAIGLLQLNVERFPRSANAYDSLADAYKLKGNQWCVAYTYRKLLEVLPHDTELDESSKVSLRRNATEQLNKLKDIPSPRNCEIMNPK